MSQFSEIFAAMGAPVLSEYLGASVVCTTGAGVASDVAGALVSGERVEDNPIGEGRELRRVRNVAAPPDALPSNLLNAKFTIDGDVYAVEAVESATESMVDVRVVRITRSELSHEGYRG